MKTLLIKETKQTPKIEFNKESNTILIEGFSMPEDPVKFYSDVFSWIEENRNKKMSLEVQLEYLNSSSALVLMDIMKTISSFDNENIILWKYKAEDVDAKETGEIYKSIVKEKLILKEV